MFTIHDSKDDSQYAARGDGLTILFDSVHWAGGSWRLKLDGTTVAIVSYTNDQWDHDNLRELT